MLFYLVRHGEAVSAHVDPERPLSASGRAEVADLARAAFERGVQVSEIRHSGILRAQQTAEILARYLNPPGGVRQTPGITPEDDPYIAKAELDLADEPMLLVGHLPHLARLSSLLTGGRQVEFSPATLVCCAKNDAGWKIEWRMVPNRR